MMARSRHVIAVNAAPTPICVHESSQKCGNTPSVRLLTMANTALRKYQPKMYDTTRNVLPVAEEEASMTAAAASFSEAPS